MASSGAGSAVGEEEKLDRNDWLDCYAVEQKSDVVHQKYLCRPRVQRVTVDGNSDYSN